MDSLTVDQFSTFGDHSTCYSLCEGEKPKVPIEFEEAPPRCYSLYEPEERVFSLPVEASEPAPIFLGSAEPEERSYTLDTTDFDHSIAPNDEDFRTELKPQVVESLYKFGFLTDEEYQRKLRQIAGLPTEESESEEEEVELEPQEPLVIQLLGGAKAMMDFRTLDVSENELEIIPEPSDRDRPYIFTFPDSFVDQHRANRFNLLEVTPFETARDPWVPPEKCFLKHHVSAIQEQTSCNIYFPDEMDLKYSQTIFEALELKFKVQVTVRNNERKATITGADEEVVQNTLRCLWLACKNFTIRAAPLTKKKLRVCQDLYSEVLTELQTLTKTKITPFVNVPEKETKKPTRRRIIRRGFSEEEEEEEE
eukprot:TRINITY_DN128_c1_g5_i1.p1 TRINITY_DN128_c1_g5~~TRINITY_DN128_c1_g5_i1.p1  ORF type:complete len:365 (+),score=83.87 TRINITY_DN128_c1_g5_i1:69-1163(+)